MTEPNNFSLPDNDSKALELQVFGERLRSVIDGKMKITAAAEAAKINYRVLNEYVNGRKEPGILKVGRIAEVCEASLDWIVLGRGLPKGVLHLSRKDDIEPESGFVIVRGLWNGYQDARSFNLDTHLTSFALGVDFIKSLGVACADLRWWRVDDAAMEPTLSKGDLLLVNSGEARNVPRDSAASHNKRLGDGIYILLSNDRPRLRRLIWRHDGGVVIKADNEVFGSETLEPEEASNLMIDGRIVWFGRSV